MKKSNCLLISWKVQIILKVNLSLIKNMQALKTLNEITPINS